MYIKKLGPQCQSLTASYVQIAAFFCLWVRFAVYLRFSTSCLQTVQTITSVPSVTVPSELMIKFFLTCQSPLVCGNFSIFSVHTFLHRSQVPTLYHSSEQLVALVIFQSLTALPIGSPSVVPQTEQVFGNLQVASLKLCASGSPSVSPHREQCFAYLQVAAIHSCDNASPFVLPHFLQVIGASQVASAQL